MACRGTAFLLLLVSKREVKKRNSKKENIPFSYFVKQVQCLDTRSVAILYNTLFLVRKKGVEEQKEQSLNHFRLTNSSTAYFYLMLQSCDNRLTLSCQRELHLLHRHYRMLSYRTGFPSRCVAKCQKCDAKCRS
jgi:hypothetical protein